MADFPIIEKLGGRDAVFNLLSGSCGLRTKDALRMWCQRGRIPGDACVALWQLAAERAIEVAPSDFQITASGQ